MAQAAWEESHMSLFIKAATKNLVYFMLISIHTSPIHSLFGITTSSGSWTAILHVTELEMIHVGGGAYRGYLISRDFHMALLSWKQTLIPTFQLVAIDSLSNSWMHWISNRHGLQNSRTGPPSGSIDRESKLPCIISFSCLYPMVLHCFFMPDIL